MKNRPPLLQFLVFLSIFQAHGADLTFSETQELLLAPSANTNVLTGDFDGDGDLDQVFQSQVGVVLCENTGDPAAPNVRYLTFPETRVATPTLEEFRVFLKAAPFSGGGKDEILAVQENTSVSLGNTPILEILEVVDNSELRSVDTLIPFFDQNDLIPVFVGQFTAQDTPQLEITDATGTNRSAATNADRLPILFDGVVDGAIDDNGDGWTDIVSEGIVFLNNSGNGSFTNTGRIFDGTFEEPVLEVDLAKAPPITGFDLIAFDADEDGDFDLSYESESGFVTLTNQGEGSFVRDESAPLATAPQDASLEEPIADNDFNGDGLVDQFVFTPRNRDGETGLTVALAQGDGSFSTAVTLSDEMTDFPPQVLDYDSDGDLDILFVHQDFFFGPAHAKPFIPPSFLQIFPQRWSGCPLALDQELQLSERGEFNLKTSPAALPKSPPSNSLTEM